MNRMIGAAIIVMATATSCGRALSDGVVPPGVDQANETVETVVPVEPLPPAEPVKPEEQADPVVPEEPAVDAVEVVEISAHGPIYSQRWGAAVAVAATLERARLINESPWPTELIPWVGCVITSESMWDTTAVGRLRERGWMQLHPGAVWQATTFYSWFGGWNAMFDPATNLAAGWAVYDGLDATADLGRTWTGQGPHAWSSHFNGCWRTHP